MNEAERQHLTELRDAHVARLRVLEKQAATFGLHAPPHVLTEIDTIKQKIADLEQQLKPVKAQALPVSTSQRSKTPKLPKKRGVSRSRQATSTPPERLIFNLN